MKIGHLDSERSVILFDGGTGTLLQKEGLAPGELPETWNLTHPDTVRSLHSAYLAAGADIIKSNTFGAYRHKYGDGLPDVIRSALTLAREAVADSGRDALVALDLGPTGRLLAPLGDLSFEDAVSLFKETVQLGAPLADLVLIETMGDLYEIKAAVVAVKESCDRPVFVTATLDAAGKLMTGADVETVAVMLEGLGVQALGMNCGAGPEAMIPLVRRLAAVTSLPIIVNPNAGLPVTEEGRTVYTTDPAAFASAMKQIVTLGGGIVGGCCGTTPEHIAVLSETVRSLPAPRPAPKHRTAVTSYTHTVVFDGGTRLIGERLNPTGKPKLKEALRAHRMEYLAEEALAQEEQGAELLDLNVGLPELDEPTVLAEAVQEVQSACGLPLVIDTTDPVAMERAVRLYNGKPLLNSVNGKQESMDRIFPIAAKYGGVLIALTLDENGIPGTAKERVAIAEKIAAEAEKYGIPREELIFDPLAMAVSSDPTAPRVTLDCVEQLTAAGYKTSLGVSNVSFGLPDREIVNRTFFALAMGAGLSAAIMNPFSQGMQETYFACRLLNGRDPGGVDYIASRTGKTASVAAESHTLTLTEAVERGLAGKAEALTRDALAGGKDPLSLVNEAVIPALNRVGAAFEKGTLFLPQLLTAAEAAKAAFLPIQAAMPASAERGPCVVLATVKGDIHDIGKNIVKVLLESYGYTVVDLGRDVPPRTVVEAVRLHAARLVGLSALMTTTVGAMEETIRALRQAGLPCRVVVGGAVMNEEYAAMIGADHYAKDASETVRYADKVFGRG